MLKKLLNWWNSVDNRLEYRIHIKTEGTKTTYISQYSVREVVGPGGIGTVWKHIGKYSGLDLAMSACHDHANASGKVKTYNTYYYLGKLPK